MDTETINRHVDAEPATMPDLTASQRHTGDTVFNSVCLLVSLFLFSQMWSQTVWAPGQNFAAQPGFWPRLAIIGMTVFSACNLWLSIRDPERGARLAGLGEELLLWLRSVEFGLWFMVYVFATPVIGYLPASVLFATALSLRAGYRSGQALIWAAIAGALTVFLFKSFLQVKIPGGMIYDYLPDGLRSLFVLYF